MSHRPGPDLHLPSLVLGVAAGCSGALLVHHGWRAFRRRYTAATPLAIEQEQSPTTEVTAESQPAQLDADQGNDPLRVLRRVKTVLQRRSDLLVVLENCNSARDRKAALRTCECLGIQEVWLIGQPHQPEGVTPSSDGPSSPAASESRRSTAGDTGGGAAAGDDAAQWLTIRSFPTAQQCIAALREERCRLWSTDLSQSAESLDAVLQEGNIAMAFTPETGRVMPDESPAGDGESAARRLAVTFSGSEGEGVSRELLDAADKRVYLPLHGFTDSLDVAASVGVIVHTIRSSAVDGCLSEERRQALYEEWRTHLEGDGTAADAVIGRNIADADVVPFRDLRLPDSLRASGIAAARKVRQRREVLSRQIQDAQRPRGFDGRSPSASVGSRQPSGASSPLVSRSSRRISFDGDGQKEQTRVTDSAGPASVAKRAVMPPATANGLASSAEQAAAALTRRGRSRPWLPPQD